MKGGRKERKEGKSRKRDYGEGDKGKGGGGREHTLHDWTRNITHRVWEDQNTGTCISCK